MKAIYFDGTLGYSHNFLIPARREGDALVRVTWTGICNTDIEIVKGYMGFKGVLGHEFVGVVEESRNSGLKGKRVVGEINIGCGRCDYCLMDLGTHCPYRSVLGILNKDGVFAEYLTLPEENLHILPDVIRDEDAVFVEPIAAGFEILEQIKISTSDRVCVLGDGKLGIIVSQVLSLTGCTLLSVGRHREKLAILEGMGLRTILHADLKEKGFDVVVDCTGSQTGIEAALDLVRPRGHVVLKTTVADWERLDLNLAVINEVTMIGSRCGPFGPAIQSLKNNQIKVAPLISRVFGIDEGIEAFHYASKRGVMKVLLRI